MSYMDSVHRDGRIWNLSVMVLLFAFPVKYGGCDGAPVRAVLIGE